MTELIRSLTVIRGSAMMLTIAIGAGLLVLPGLAFDMAGDHAFLAWIAAGLTAIPLIGVVMILGARHPGPGGVAHFANTAFGRRGYGASVFLFLGAVLFGIPSIALTGGHYAADLIGGAPHLHALMFLAAASAINIAPLGKISGISTLLAAVIIVLVAGIITAGLVQLNDPFNLSAALPSAPVLSVGAVFLPFMAIFFAFTGWEAAAGMSGEFRNPRRDFPRAVAVSFLVTTALYLAMAYVVQRATPGDAILSPFAGIIGAAFGPYARAAVDVTAVAIILANLTGAIYVVSRMVFSLGQERFLPGAMTRLRRGVPVAAVGVTAAALIAVLITDWAGLLGIERMLTLAGQNFFILYAIMAAVLFRLGKNAGEKSFATVTLALSAVLLAGYGSGLLYPAALAATGIALAARRG